MFGAPPPSKKPCLAVFYASRFWLFSAQDQWGQRLLLSLPSRSAAANEREVAEKIADKIDRRIEGWLESRTMLPIKYPGPQYCRMILELVEALEEAQPQLEDYSDAIETEFEEIK